MTGSTELIRAISALTSTVADNSVAIRDLIASKAAASRSAAGSTTTTSTTGGTRGTATPRIERIQKHSLERAENLNKELSVTNREIDRINKQFFHQKNIIDEIKESQESIRDLLKEREKLEKELKKYNEDDEEYYRIKDKLGQNELATRKAVLRLREQEQKKQIEGYNKLDEVSETFDNRTKAIKRGISEIKEGIKQIGDAVGKILGPWTKMSQSAADYAKNIGLSGKGMDRLRKSTIDAVANRGIGIKYNTSVEELIKLQEGYTNTTGRQIQFSNSNYENIAATSKLLGEEGTQDYFAKLENFGLSIDDAADRAGKMFATASKSGLSLDKLSKNIRDNISLAQKYTFKNGVRGLESMAKKATEIGLNMSQAAAFAEKVNTVEGAIKTGAQLQVLGGPFAQMADPIGMLYESLNDMEGLQDRMTQMFGNLGSFNKQTGEVEISAFNRVRIKEAAKAMGMDENNIFEAINTSARRNEIARQLQGNPNVDKDTAELLKNVGVIQNGVAGANINGKFVEAGKITSADNKYLKAIAKSESDDVKDIAMLLRGWDDSIQGFQKQKDAIHGQLVETSGIGKGVQNLINNVGEMKELLSLLVKLTMAAGAVSMLGGAFNMIKGGTRMFKGAGNLVGKGPKGGGAHYVNPKTGKGYVYKGGKLKNVATGRTVPSNVYGYDKLLKGAKIGKVGAAVSKGANIAGWIGLAGELGTDYMVNSGKWKKGGFGDFAGHMGSQALGYGALGAQVGGMIGSVVPVIGTAVGTIVGGAIGAIGGAISGYAKAKKNKLYREIEEKGVKLYGNNYSKSELKQIKAAASGDGKISERLLEKMQMNGDQEAIEKLHSVVNEVISNGTVRVTVVNAQKKATGGIIEGSSETGDKVPIMSNAGEMVLNDTQQANLFNAINTGDFSSVARRPQRESVEVARGTNNYNGISQNLSTVKGDFSSVARRPQRESLEVARRTNNYNGISQNLSTVEPRVAKPGVVAPVPGVTENAQAAEGVQVTPRPNEDTIMRPEAPVEKPVRFELSGTWNINIGGTINAVAPDGTNKKVEIDTDELKKIVERTLATKISEELSRMERAGRIVPEKGYLYQRG